MAKIVTRIIGTGSGDYPPSIDYPTIQDWEDANGSKRDEPKPKIIIEAKP